MKQLMQLHPLQQQQLQLLPQSGSCPAHLHNSLYGTLSCTYFHTHGRSHLQRNSYRWGS